jgi:hypothetical protein
MKVIISNEFVGLMHRPDKTLKFAIDIYQFAHSVGQILELPRFLWTYSTYTALLNINKGRTT